MDISRNVFITGITTFIGSHIVYNLLDEGFSVYAYISKSLTGEYIPIINKFPNSKNLYIIVIPEFTENNLDLHLSKCKYCIHTSCSNPSIKQMSPEERIEESIKMTRILLESCQKHQVEKFILVGSVQSMISKIVTIKHPILIHENSWTLEEDCLSYYQKRKLKIEKTVWNYFKLISEKDKLKLTVINSALAIGKSILPETPAAYELIKNILKRKINIIPQVAIPLVNINDLVSYVFSALKNDALDGKRIICQNNTVYLNEILLSLRKEFKFSNYHMGNVTVMEKIEEVLAIFSPEFGELVKGMWLNPLVIDNESVFKIMGIKMHEWDESINELAHYMLDRLIISPIKKKLI